MPKAVFWKTTQAQRQLFKISKFKPKQQKKAGRRYLRRIKRNLQMILRKGRQ